ncbi:MAG: ArnT family glycosyltransferase, partial [Candidatus Binatia bacterium]
MRNPRRIVLGCVLVALTLRIAFVLTAPARPLYWDEPYYDDAAKMYQRAWSSLLDAGAGPTLLEAFRKSLQKGEAYAAMIGGVYALVGEQHRSAFLLQAVLDAVTCLLLYGLARALGGARAGVCAVALGAVYEPLIFSAARLQAETLTSLFVVSGLWAICVPERRRALGAFGGGIAIAGSMLARPAVQYLFPLLVPAVALRSSDRSWRFAALAALAFAAGFAVVVVPRSTLTKVATGDALWSGTLDPSVDLYAGAVLANRGWKTNYQAFALPPRDELLEVLGNDPGRRPTLSDYRAATVRTWLAHPAASAAVALHKLYVAWLYPYNDSHWIYLTGRGGEAFLHRAILALGLAGMPLAFRRWRVGVPLITAALYLWLSYLVIKIEVRYAVVAMPLMICFAGLAIAALSRGWEREWRTGRRGRLLMIVSGSAIALLGAHALTLEQLLRWLPLAPETAHGLQVAVLLGAVSGLAYLFAALALDAHGRCRAFGLLSPALVLAVLVVLFGRPLAESWREWHATLTPNHGVVRQEFVLPARIDRPTAALLKLDLLPTRQGVFDLVVRLNGQEIKRYRGGLTRADAELPPGFVEPNSVAQQREAEPLRSWYAIPIAPHLITPNTRLVVEVALEPAKSGDVEGAVAVFGDYAPGDGTYAGPSLLAPGFAGDTSLYKYIAEGDFRMRRRVPLAGASR